jgi:transposase-like protein
MTRKHDDKVMELAQEVFQDRDGLKALLELLLNQVMGVEVGQHLGAEYHTSAGASAAGIGTGRRGGV